MVDQQGNILFSLTQRRKFQLDHVDPIVEVFSELSLLHHFKEVPVGGGYDTNIRQLALYRSEGFIGLFL